MRHTKIIATLGPSSQTRDGICALMDTGVNIFRLNCSHGQHAVLQATIALIREIAISKEMICPGILIDLQGPKIRINSFKDGGVELTEGQTFSLDFDCPQHAGDAKRVGYTYANLATDVAVGDDLILDDGHIALRVMGIQDRLIQTTVLNSGRLSSKKGINLKNGGLTAPSFTEKDKKDLDFAIEQDVDFVALSFVKNAADVYAVREKINASSKAIQLISKIERSDALNYLDEISRISDGLMIARGDLALEIGFAKVPAAQKQIIRAARKNNNFVIVATQMMESMITSNHPTRAEVSDVANAILDDVDALMLSAETAVGNHPALVTRAMHEICLETESYVEHHDQDTPNLSRLSKVSMVVADQAIQVGRALGARAVVIYTEYGSTAKYASRQSSTIPIFGMSRVAKTCQLMQVFRGVRPIQVTYDRLDYEDINTMAVKHLLPILKFKDQDKIVIVKGDLIGVSGHTNSIEVWNARQLLEGCQVV